MPPLIALALAAVAVEILFLIGSLASPTVDILLSSPARGGYLRSQPDERVRWRPSPSFPEHDARGFRNPVALEKAQIVALGDSQTYGWNAEPDDAWPRRLEEMTGQTVYGAAFGGYCPVQSLELWEEVKGLQPDVVIEAFYTGNDLSEAFYSVHGEGSFPELGSTEPEILRSLEGQEAVDLIEALDRGHQEGRANRAAATSFAGRVMRSRILGLLRRLRQEARHRLVSDEERWQSAVARGGVGWRNETIQTVFTPEYRLGSVAPDRPSVREGQRIVQRALVRLDREVKATGAHLVVALIPTKELVFAEAVDAQTAEQLAPLVEAETEALRRLASALDEAGVDWVSTLPALRETVASGTNPYHPTEDGHPLRPGHQAIARAIAEHLAAGPRQPTPTATPNSEPESEPTEDR